MSQISITSIKLNNNPAPIADPFDFSIEFECYAPLVQSDLELRVTYVSSPEDGEIDHVLGELDVGPLTLNENTVRFSIPAPSFDAIPLKDRYQHHAIKVSCLYRSAVFARYGFYVLHEMPPHDTNMRTRWVNAYSEALESDVKSLTDLDALFSAVQQSLRQSNKHSEQQNVPRNTPCDRVWRIVSNYPITTKYSIQWDEQPEQFEKQLEVEVQQECQELAEIVKDRCEDFTITLANEARCEQQANDATDDEATEDESEIDSDHDQSTDPSIHQSQSESDNIDSGYDLGSEDTDEEQQSSKRARTR